jgi:CzcA family heavy metal efflux pump
MIDRLIDWSLRNGVLVMVLAAGFLVGGTWVALRMSVDVLPDLTAPTVTVLIEGEGMAPTDMEALVTFPIEAALNGAAGVRRVRSATAVGVAVIWVEFEWSQDIYRARQTVTEKLTVVSDSLPPEVGAPVLAPVSSIMGEILFVALESDRHSPLDLRATADTVLRRRLLAVPGVSQVVVTGGGEKQYQVVVDPKALMAYELGLGDVEKALQGANRNTSAGFRISGGQEYLIQGVGRVGSVDDIARTVIDVREGQPVLVRDVAQVSIGEAIKRGEGAHNGRPAVVLGIQKQPAVNSLELTRLVDRTLDDIQRTLPQGMAIRRNLFRSADFIETAIDNLVAALREGTLLVVVVVFVFLVNLRASLIALAAIPLSLLAAVVVLRGAGATINSMTLGGMAIAIGALVDDAIIDVENVFRRLRENAKRGEAERQPALSVVAQASKEVRGSIVFATIIIMLVFLPLFFLSGVEGRLLRPLGLAYIVALFASLVVALTVTPVLCLWLLPNTKGVQRGHEAAVVRVLKRVYARWLEPTLDHAPVVLAAAAALTVVTLASFALLGRSFLPEFNEGSLTLSSVSVPGVSLAESNKLGASLEKLLLTVPEVTATARRTGRAELDEHVQGVESAELDVQLRRSERSREEVLQDIRDKASLIPGTNVTIGQPISHRIDHMLSGTRANIAVKVFGDDLTVLRSLAQQVQAAMQHVPGVVDLSTEQQTDIPTVRVRFNREALARYGMPAGAAAEALEVAMRGREVAQITEANLIVPLVLRYQQTDASDLETIRQTLIDTPSGVRVPIGAVADVSEDRGPNFISRENVQRKIVVQCNVSGRDLRSVVNDIQAAVGRDVRLPQGYHVEYGGQFESEAQASQLLLLLGLAVIVGIFFILASAFDSTLDAAIVMANLPLALIGGVIGIYLSGGVMSIASMIGLIALFGIATRNGIMLLSHIRTLQEQEGEADVRAAVTRGALERLSPILMTALATGLALVPIVRGSGEPGSEIQAPMALVILSGLASSTLLNMFVVPAAYWRTHRVRGRAA